MTMTTTYAKKASPKLNALASIAPFLNNSKKNNKLS